MKTYKIIISITLLFICFSSYSQLKVDGNGDIELKSDYWNGGIKAGIIDYGGFSIPALYPNTANYAGLGSASKYFHDGYIYHLFSASYDSWPSDGRLKENIRSIDSALDKIDLLNPIQYDIKDSFFKGLTDEAKERNNKISKDRLGFIAQELQEVFPDLVHTEPTTGYYSVSTFELIPVLVKAVQEQKQIIENLQGQVESCCQAGLKNASLKGDSGDELDAGIAKLYQNAPNPFSAQTTIRFEIPESVQNAQLHILNMNGTLLKTLQINQRGAGNVIVSANEFVAGMYLYSLVCDGKIIDTKRILLTE